MGYLLIGAALVIGVIGLAMIVTIIGAAASGGTE